MMKELSWCFFIFTCCLLSSIVVSSCSSDNDEPEVIENKAIEIVENSWYSEYISSTITNYDLLVFKSGGTFTKYAISKFQSYTPNRILENGTYHIDGDNIYIMTSDYTDNGKFSIKDGALRLDCSKSSLSGTFYRSSLQNLDNIVIGRSYMEMEPIEDVVVKSPYRNFMYGWYSGTHCYVELAKVEMQCEHGFDGDANAKYLRFCGSNGNVSPDGAVVIYMRPSWEGIDKYWSDGTYKTNEKGGYYSYTMHPYFNGHDYVGSEKYGVLTIKSNGDFKVFDYKSDLLRIHFEGTFQK